MIMTLTWLPNPENFRKIHVNILQNVCFKYFWQLIYSKWVQKNYISTDLWRKSYILTGMNGNTWSLIVENLNKEIPVHEWFFFEILLISCSVERLTDKASVWEPQTFKLAGHYCNLFSLKFIEVALDWHKQHNVSLFVQSSCSLKSK